MFEIPISFSDQLEVLSSSMDAVIGEGGDGSGELMEVVLAFVFGLRISADTFVSRRKVNTGES